MINWNISTPKRLIAGGGSIDHLPHLLNELQLQTPFVVIDPLVKESKFGYKALGFLKSFNCQIITNSGSNPTFSHVRSGLEKFDNWGHDAIIAIGGGSTIDLAKVIGLVAANGGQPEDYFHGKKALRAPVPLIAVPTTCGTGSEGSPYSVIMDTSIPKKRGLESPLLMPVAVILDHESLLSLDRIMIAATGIDAFSHILESHLSRKATALTRIFSRGLLYSIRESLEKAVFERDLSALENLHSIAFTARLLYPRTGLSIAHVLSHPFGAYTNIHHGLAVVIFLEASLMYNLPYCEELVRDAEAAMGLVHKHTSLFSWLSSIIRNSGMEKVLIEALPLYDLPIEKIAADALQSSNIPSNPREIQVQNACDIIRKSLARFGVKC